jgi:hypothetical protein
MLFRILLSLLLLGPTHGKEVEFVHDLHITTGNFAVEGSLAVLNIRIFKDDLEEALARHGERESLRMAADPETEALFAAYFTERFTFEVAGESLTGTIIGSGEDEADREPIWWYQIRFDAPQAIRSARIMNTLLLEIFDDQRNILKVIHYPEQVPRTFYFASGEEWADISF